KLNAPRTVESCAGRRTVIARESRPARACDAADYAIWIDFSDAIIVRIGEISVACRVLRRTVGIAKRDGFRRTSVKKAVTSGHCGGQIRLSRAKWGEADGKNPKIGVFHDRSPNYYIQNR